MQPEYKQKAQKEIDLTIQAPHEMTQIDSVIIDFIKKFETFDHHGGELESFSFSYADTLISALQKSSSPETQTFLAEYLQRASIHSFSGLASVLEHIQPNQVTPEILNAIVGRIADFRGDEGARLLQSFMHPFELASQEQIRQLIYPLVEDQSAACSLDKGVLKTLEDFVYRKCPYLIPVAELTKELHRRFNKPIFTDGDMHECNLRIIPRLRLAAKADNQTAQNALFTMATKFESQSEDRVQMSAATALDALAGVRLSTKQQEIALSQALREDTSPYVKEAWYELITAGDLPGIETKITADLKNLVAKTSRKAEEATRACILAGCKAIGTPLGSDTMKVVASAIAKGLDIGPKWELAQLIAAHKDLSLREDLMFKIIDKLEKVKGDSITAQLIYQGLTGSVGRAIDIIAQDLPISDKGAARLRATLLTASSEASIDKVLAVHVAASSAFKGTNDLLLESYESIKHERLGRILAEYLGERRDDQIVGQFTKKLLSTNKSDVEISLVGLKGIKELSSQAVERLQRLASRRHPQHHSLQSDALRTLMDLEDPETIPVVMNLLAKQFDFRSESAISSVEHRSSTRQIDLLASILRDPRLGSQERCASFAVEELKNYRAGEPKVEMILRDYLGTIKGKETPLHHQVSNALLADFPTPESLKETLGRLWRQSFNRDFAPNIGFDTRRGGFHHDEGAIPTLRELAQQIRTLRTLRE